MKKVGGERQLTHLEQKYYRTGTLAVILVQEDGFRGALRIQSRKLTEEKVKAAAWIQRDSNSGPRFNLTQRYHSTDHLRHHS